MNKFNFEDLLKSAMKVNVDNEAWAESVWQGENYPFNRIFESIKTNLDFTNKEEVGAACDIAMLALHKKNQSAKSGGIELLHWLCENGVLAAKFNLAIEKLKGNYLVKITPDDVITLLIQVIVKEDNNEELVALAYKSLADCYYKGYGVKKDLDVALGYFKQSADFGDWEAAFNTGLFYHGKIGDGEKYLDFNRAAYYYKLATEQGHLHAQTNLGLLHITKSIDKSDVEYGIHLLKKSICDGDRVAKEILDHYKINESEQQKSNTNNSVESSIKKGDFEEGAQLPYDHPDFKRITHALFNDDKSQSDFDELNKDNKDKPLTIREMLGNKSIEELMMGARAHARKNIIMNYLSINRAAGNIPDVIFNNLLQLVSSDLGRTKFVAMMGDKIFV